MLNQNLGLSFEVVCDGSVSPPLKSLRAFVTV